MLPERNDAPRPLASPVDGMLRPGLRTGRFEEYRDGHWRVVGAGTPSSDAPEGTPEAKALMDTCYRANQGRLDP